MNLRKNRWIFIIAILFIGAFIYDYPSFITFSDETRYLHSIYLFKEEARLKVTDPLDSHSFLYNGRDYTTAYPIGITLLAYPFALFGYKALFLMNFLMLMIGFYFFNKILKKLNYNSLYSLLYLLYPGFVFFSRTLMSEMPSIALITTGLYFYIREKNNLDYLYSGFFFGLAAIFRYPNFIVYILMGVVLFYNEFETYKFNVKRYKKITFFLISSIPTIMSILLYNYYINGGFLSTGYSHVMGLGRDPVWHMLGYYFLTLNLVYPLMLLAPVFIKSKYKKEILLSCFVTLLAYIFVGIDTFHYDFLKNLVIGARYVFPVMPFFLLAYVIFLDDIFSKMRLKKNTVLILISIVLLIGAATISHQQFNFTYKSKIVKDKIYSVVPEGAVMYAPYSSLTYLNQFYGDNKIVFIDNPGVPEIMGNMPEEEYIVFAQQGTYKEISGEDYSTSENKLKNKFNLKKAYGESSPDQIRIYKIVK